MRAFDPSNIRTWIFDLDNTLYHPGARLFDQINRRMTSFIAQALVVAEVEADRLRKTYWLAHGTTLAGLRRHHDIDPDAFLDYVHRIDLTGLSPIQRLPNFLIASQVRKSSTRMAPAHMLRMFLPRAGLLKSSKQFSELTT